MIERFNRTVKEFLLKYFCANNTRKCVDVLELLVDQYNNAIGSSTKMTPQKQVERKTKIQCGEIYIQKLVVRP